MITRQQLRLCLSSRSAPFCPSFCFVLKIPVSSAGRVSGSVRRARWPSTEAIGEQNRGAGAWRRTNPAAAPAGRPPTFNVRTDGRDDRPDRGDDEPDLEPERCPPRALGADRARQGAGRSDREPANACRNQPASGETRPHVRLGVASTAGAVDGPRPPPLPRTLMASRRSAPA